MNLTSRSSVFLPCQVSVPASGLAPTQLQCPFFLTSVHLLYVARVRAQLLRSHLQMLPTASRICAADVLPPPGQLFGRVRGHCKEGHELVTTTRRTLSSALLCSICGHCTDDRIVQRFHWCHKCCVGFCPWCEWSSTPSNDMTFDNEVNADTIAWLKSYLEGNSRSMRMAGADPTLMDFCSTHGTVSAACRRSTATQAQSVLKSGKQSIPATQWLPGLLKQCCAVGAALVKSTNNDWQKINVQEGNPTSVVTSPTPRCSGPVCPSLSASPPISDPPEDSLLMKDIPMKVVEEKWQSRVPNILLPAAHQNPCLPQATLYGS